MKQIPEVSPEMQLEIISMLERFNNTFWEDFQNAYKSGALSGEESPLVVARCVMQITAEKFYMPDLANSKKILANLRHFI